MRYAVGPDEIRAFLKDKKRQRRTKKLKATVGELAIAKQIARFERDG